MLADLITRIEKATGPDRELDRDIDLFFNPEAKVWSPSWYSGPANDYLIWGSEETDDLDYRQIERLTESVDAVLALIARTLPGCVWGVSDGEDHGPYAFVHPREEELAGAMAATPALALLICLLRAKQKEDSSHE